MSSSKAAFSLRTRNPDVLTCIANLSNDEVFTPPDFANRMLNSLTEAWQAQTGANIWADRSVRFLDPFTKSGVFLREIATRLIDGLQEEIPDLQARVDHILTKQVYGIGITYLTSLLARRSVYCSKFANGPHSIVKSFADEAGHIVFERTEHKWVGATEFVTEAGAGTGEVVKRGTNGKCHYCGASQGSLDRGDVLETHAYTFIHTDNIEARLAELFGETVQFDVIIGNPPYQLDDGGYGTSAAPIYNKFVETALNLDPRYAVFVTPSRWFAGGKGLDKYRERLLSDRRMRNLVDYPKLYDAFPGVKIRGGISYFLWDRDYEGPCTIQTMWEGQPVGEPVARYLDAFDILVRRNEAVSILEKVRAKDEPTLESRVSSRKPFGFPTNFHGKATPRGLKDPVKLFGSQKITWIERSVVLQNEDWIDQWKVLVTRVQGTSAAVERIFLGKPIVSGPGEACTETYLVAGLFDDEQQAKRYAIYLRTRFVRFLVSLRKNTQDAARDVYAFVPDLPLNREWSDRALYARYNLTVDEIGFIEAQVAEHTDAADHEVVDE